MAVKDKTQTQKMETSAPAGSVASADTGSTGNGESTSKPRGVAKGTKRGPANPAKRWAMTKEDRRKRDIVLAQVLKDPALGTVKTAATVAEVLSTRPEFEGVELSPTMVNTRVKRVIASKEKKGEEIKPYLRLGAVNLGVLEVDTELFD